MSALLPGEGLMHSDGLQAVEEVRQDETTVSLPSSASYISPDNLKQVHENSNAVPSHWFAKVDPDHTSLMNA